MDTTIISALISASVAILISVLNYFVVAPIKEGKERKSEQLKNLYAPLYGIICARLSIIKAANLNQTKLMMGSLSDKEYTDRSYMEKYLLDNSGYASESLLSIGIEYLEKTSNYDEVTTYNFVSTLVKEYNQLKKDLKLEYNEDELKTGIPECVKSLRKIYNT